MSRPRPRPWFAEQSVRPRSDAGSYLEYLLDPQIPFPGSRCRSTMKVMLATALLSCRTPSSSTTQRAGRKISRVVAARSSSTPPKARRWRSTVSKADGGAFQGKRPGVSGAFAAQGTLVVAGRNLPIARIAGERRNISLDYPEAAKGASQLPKSRGCWCGCWPRMVPP
jgi:hypothetical protein